MENLLGMVQLIDKEFGEIIRNGKFRGKDEIDSVYKMMDIVKDAFCVWDYEAKMNGGYSEYGYNYIYPMTDYPYENGNSYTSYARGRSMPRNRMGQFTSREGGYNGSSYRDMNYSRTDAKSDFMNQLRAVVQNAPDEHLREYAQSMIHEMEQM